MNHDGILKNRASRTEAVPQEVHCTVCGEPLVFGMRDTHHEFSVGMRFVLSVERKGKNTIIFEQVLAFDHERFQRLI